MRLITIVLAAVFGVFAVDCEAQRLPDYTGTWSFVLEVVGTSCEGDVNPNFDLEITQDGALISAVPAVAVGTTLAYSGLVTRDVATMAEKSLCPVVPNPTCSTEVGVLSLVKKDSLAKPKRARVVAVTHQRTDNGEYSCTTILKGMARKQKNKSK